MKLLSNKMKITKAFIVVALLLSISSSSFAQEKINWMSWEEAIEANAKEPKKIMVDAYTWWCGWCKRMDATTFTNPVIVKELNEHYYSVKFNAEQAEPITYKGKTYINPKPGVNRSTHEFAIALLRGQLSYPQFVLLDEAEQMLQVITGYKEAPKMEVILKFFGGDSYKTVSGEDYQKTFISEITAK